MGDFLFFGTLLSGSLYAAVRHGRKFEEILLITSMSIVLILFLFGLINKLQYGVTAVLAVAGALIFSAVVCFCKKNHTDRSVVYKNILTPGFFLFVAYVIILYFAQYNLLAYEWDSFSHWMDSVKAMVTMDDFVTNPSSNSMFQSYPPGMALFQYFMQKVCLFFSPEATFVEWRAFFAYSVFAMSLLVPFFSNLTFSKPLGVIFRGIIVFLIPLRFDVNMHATVMIDPFVGLLAGSGFAALMLYTRRDGVHLLHILLTCITLVLAKDVGMFFGIFISIAYILQTLCWTAKSLRTCTKGIQWGQLGVSCMPLVCMLAVKELWKNDISSNGARVLFGNKIPLLKYTEIFLFGNDDSYFQVCVDAFKAQFFKPLISIFWGGGKLFTISYFAFTVIIIVLAFFLCKIYARKNPSKSIDSRIAIVLIITQLLVYTYSLGATYLGNFTEYEAVKLASYNRYLNMAYLCAWTAIILGWLEVLPEKIHKPWIGVLAAFLVVFFLDYSTVKPLAKMGIRYSVQKSHRIRSPYEPIRMLIQQQCDGDDKIYVISQGDSGFDYWVTKFNARPNVVSAGMWDGRMDVGWSLGEPFKEKDHYTRAIPAEDLKTVLFNEYNYLAILKVEDTFIKNYGHLFKCVDDIQENSLFYVNKNSQLLEKCQ